MQTTASESERPRRSLVPAVFAALRPRQWIKNLFVFGPLLFSGRMMDPATNVRAATGFAYWDTASLPVAVLSNPIPCASARL